MAPKTTHKMTEDVPGQASDNATGKSGRIGNDDQFLFLISCVRHSNNGKKVDFGKVASECEIVSKGAAAKRYERMMKAHGINHNSQATPRDSSLKSTPRSKSKPAGSVTPNKKRKIADVDDGSQDKASKSVEKGSDTLSAPLAELKDEDDEDQTSPFTPINPVKAEPESIDDF